MDEYEVRVTRQALEQMKEIMHYISNDLMVPDAANNLLDKIKAEIMKLSCFPKKHALIDEEPWRTEGMRKIVVKNFLIADAIKLGSLPIWIWNSSLTCQGIGELHRQFEKSVASAL